MRASWPRGAGALVLLLCVAGTEPSAAQDVAPSQAVAWPDSTIVRHRHRSKRTRRAAPDSTTLLQLEAGYDGNFDAPDLARDQSSALTMVVTPTARLALQADMDVWASQRAPGSDAVHGHGDLRLTVQTTLRAARPGQVSLGVAYEIKLPTARPDTLGSGQVDHRLLPLLSLAVRRVEVDVTGGLDANGRTGGLDWGVEGAVTVTYAVAHQVTASVGWSGQTVDTDQPAGHFVSAGTTWQLNPLLGFDLGGRVGLSAGAPAFGVTVGATAAVLRAL